MNVAEFFFPGTEIGSVDEEAALETHDEIL
jgi:hypothetical protein